VRRRVDRAPRGARSTADADQQSATNPRCARDGTGRDDDAGWSARSSGGRPEDVTSERNGAATPPGSG
jgi:hypothetical protein